MSSGELKAQERYLSALSTLVTGGLWVGEEPGNEGEAERALCRVAGAMLKAVTVAGFAPDVGDEDLDAGGWVADSSEFTRNEMHDALHGIVALLSAGPVVIEKLRARGELRLSHERTGRSCDRGASTDEGAPSS